MPIATKAPMITIHTGRFDGRLKPNSKPVKIAEPSEIVGSFFKIYFVIAHSKNTHAATLDAQTTTEPKPKYRNDTINAGTNAIITPYILRSTLSVPCACGDNETINLLIF